LYSSTTLTPWNAGFREGDAMKEATIRELEAHLRDYVRIAAEGEDVRVSVDGHPVVKLVALAALRSEVGVTWAGGKPVGIPDAEAAPPGVSLADWVIEDRR
jgi:prevent-host-death family protein